VHMLLFNTSSRTVRRVLLFITAIVIAPNATAQQSGPSSTPSKKAAAYSGLEMLTPDGGADFGEYLKSVYKSVKLRWFAGMPKSVSDGEQGVVIIKFHIQTDGTIPADSLKFDIPPSGKDELDKAALKAVQLAAPFGNLPAKFTQPFIDLRMTFFYNIEPGKR
jgi:TonB family protein